MGESQGAPPLNPDRSSWTCAGRLEGTVGSHVSLQSRGVSLVKTTTSALVAPNRSPLGRQFRNQ